MRWKAIQYMILSTLAFAIMNLIVKYLDGFSSYQLVLFRSVGTLIITFPYLIYNRINILGNKRFLLFARALVGTISLVTFFVAIKMMPIGTCVTLRHLSPIFAALFAMYLIKEKVLPLQWIFFLLSFSGVLLIKGFDTGLSAWAVAIVLFSGALSGLVVVLIRKIGYDDHPIVIVNYFSSMGFLLGMIGTYFTWQMPQGIEWALLFSLGFIGFIGQIFMTKALQAESTDLMAPMKYLEIPFTILIGMTFLGETYAMASVIGFILIIAGLIANVIYKTRQKTVYN